MKPIAWDVAVHVPGAQKEKLRVELCKQHNVPNGVPLNESPTAEHRDAGYMLERGLRVQITVIGVRKDGTLIFEARGI